MFTILLWFMIENLNEIFWDTVWVLPIMMLMWAEDSLADKVNDTDSMALERMMELADSDIWHASEVDDLNNAKLAEQVSRAELG